jgi:hypothetical protein
MKKVMCFAAILSMALTSCMVVAQAPASPAAQSPANNFGIQPAAPTVPVDQQPSREQLVRLFQVMRIHQQLDTMLKMIPAMAKQQMQAQARELATQMPDKKITPERQAQMDKLMDRIMAKAVNILSFDEMMDDMVGLYQRYLTRQDVEAMTGFYESPAGQHLLDAQPAIMQQYMPMVMKRVTERSKALTDDLAKEIKDSVQAGDGK